MDNQRRAQMNLTPDCSGHVAQANGVHEHVPKDNRPSVSTKLNKPEDSTCGSTLVMPSLNAGSWADPAGLSVARLLITIKRPFIPLMLRSVESHMTGLRTSDLLPAYSPDDGRLLIGV